VEGACKCRNKPSGSIKCGEFLGYMRNCQLLLHDVRHMTCISGIEKVVPGLEQLVFCLSTCWPGSTGTVHMGFVVDNMPATQVFLRALRFSLVIFIHHCSITIIFNINLARANGRSMWSCTFSNTAVRNSILPSTFCIIFSNNKYSASHYGPPAPPFLPQSYSCFSALH
jgi:hypothetical protein